MVNTRLGGFKMANTFEVEILEDGMLKIDSEAFSESMHKNADDLLEAIIEAMGGSVTTTKKEHNFWKNKNVLRKIVEVKK